MQIARASLVLLAALWIGSHTARGESTVTKAEVVGKWDEVEGGETVELFPNGAFATQSGESKFEGRYKFLEDGRVQMDVEGEIGKKISPIIRTVSLGAEEPTLADADRKTTKYRRPNKK
jgi:hypothetical protein